ncbi:hypothetical protein ROZALSC1DRAFT_24643, partial [Rozella allomycis CSF55]
MANPIRNNNNRKDGYSIFLEYQEQNHAGYNQGSVYSPSTIINSYSNNNSYVENEFSSAYIETQNIQSFDTEYHKSTLHLKSSIVDYQGMMNNQNFDYDQNIEAENESINHNYKEQVSYNYSPTSKNENETDEIEKTSSLAEKLKKAKLNKISTQSQKDHEVDKNNQWSTTSAITQNNKLDTNPNDEEFSPVSSSLAEKLKNAKLKKQNLTAATAPPLAQTKPLVAAKTSPTIQSTDAADYPEPPETGTLADQLRKAKLKKTNAAMAEVGHSPYTENVSAVNPKQSMNSHNVPKTIPPPPPKGYGTNTIRSTSQNRNNNVNEDEEDSPIENENIKKMEKNTRQPQSRIQNNSPPESY